MPTDDLSRPEMDYEYDRQMNEAALKSAQDELNKVITENNHHRLALARSDAAKDRLRAIVQKVGMDPDGLIGTQMHATIEKLDKIEKAADAAAASMGQNASALRASGQVGRSPSSGVTAVQRNGWPQAGQPLTVADAFKGAFSDLGANGQSYVNLLLTSNGQPIARLNPDLEIEQELPHDLVLTVQMRSAALGQMIWECLLCGAAVFSQEQHQAWHESILVKNFDLYTDHVIPAGPTIEEYPA